MGPWSQRLQPQQQKEGHRKLSAVSIIIIVISFVRIVITGNVCDNDRKDVTRGIFTEAELAGKSTPSVYNLSNMEKYKTAAPSYDWKISKTIRIQPLKKTPADRSEVSPSSYKYDESLKKRIFTSEPKYS